MPIREWHWGKIVLLWGAGVVLVWLLVILLAGMVFTSSTPIIAYAVAFLGSGIVIAVPVALFLVTWKWLTGKEHR